MHRLDARELIEVCGFLWNICSAVIFFDENSTKWKFFYDVNTSNQGMLKHLLDNFHRWLILQKKNFIYKTSIFTRDASVWDDKRQKSCEQAHAQVNEYKQLIQQKICSEKKNKKKNIKTWKKTFFLCWPVLLRVSSWENIYSGAVSLLLWKYLMWSTDLCICQKKIENFLGRVCFLTLVERPPTYVLPLTAWSVVY